MCKDLQRHFVSSFRFAPKNVSVFPVLPVDICRANRLQNRPEPLQQFRITKQWSQLERRLHAWPTVEKSHENVTLLPSNCNPTQIELVSRLFHCVWGEF